MEVGKCYIDGEGFYKAKYKPDERTIIMEAVIVRDNGVSYYDNLHYNIRACERRMVECPLEVYERVKEKAGRVIADLYNLNTVTFLELWSKKEELYGSKGK